MAKAKQISSPFSVLFLLLFALMPLIYIESLVDKTLIPRQMFASVMLIITGFLMYRNKQAQNLAVPPVLWLYTGFVLINMVSVVAAINPAESWAIISRYFVGLVFLMTAIVLLHNGLLKTTQLVQAIVLFGAISALITLVNILQAIGSGQFVDNIYSVSGSFGHKNLLSSALMLSFPFAVMGSIVLDSKAWRKFSLALALLLVAEMFVLRTRGVWLSMFVGTAVCLLTYLAVRKRAAVNTRLPVKWIGIGGGLAIVILVGLFLTKGFSENIGNRSNLYTRIVFWQNSVEMIEENPLLGVGAGNWRINFPKYGLSNPVEENSVYRLNPSVYQGITHIQRPHNDYLWVWAESGPLGLLFFLGIFAAALVRIAKNLRHFKTPEDLSLDLLSLFGITAYLVFSLTDFPLERTSHTLLMLSLVALPYRKIDTESGIKIPVSVGSFVAITLLIFSVVVCYYRWEGEEHTVDILEANRTRNARAIIPAVDAAVQPFYNMDYYANPLRYYSSIGKLALNNTQGAFEDAQAALDVHPYNIIVLNQVGNVYKAKGQPDEALKYYHRAVEISHWFESARLNLAEIYLQNNEPVEAMRALALVPRSSRNPKYLDLLSKALPRLVESFPEHQKFGPLVEYLEQRQPKNRRDYVNYFLQFKIPSNGQT